MYDPFDNSIYVGRNQIEFRGPRVGEEAFYCHVKPSYFIQDLMGYLLAGAVFRKILPQHLERPAYSREGIFYLMSDCGREFADGSHLFQVQIFVDYAPVDLVPRPVKVCDD